MKLENITPGLYWIRFGAQEAQWDAIAIVSGKKYFLDVKILDIESKTIFDGHRDYELDKLEWGPRIPYPDEGEPQEEQILLEWMQELRDGKLSFVSEYVDFDLDFKFRVISQMPDKYISHLLWEDRKTKKHGTKTFEGRIEAQNYAITVIKEAQGG